MAIRCQCFTGLLLLVLVLGVLAGCKDNSDATPRGETEKPTPKASKDNGDGNTAAGHSHERAKSLIVDAGKYHARLTAHLSSKAGNELDMFFETTDEENPVAVAIPTESFTAQARTGDGTDHKLQFKPAPADERPKGEKAGTCSHFVAKAGWMKPADRLHVVARVPLGDGTYRIEWKDFDPKKYAHHGE